MCKFLKEEMLSHRGAISEKTPKIFRGYLLPHPADTFNI